MTEVCCGTTCDKEQLEAEFRAAGATEFVAYLEDNVTEDCSTVAIAALLASYIDEEVFK